MHDYATCLYTLFISDAVYVVFGLLTTYFRLLVSLSSLALELMSNYKREGRGKNGGGENKQASR